eukprot:14076497-Ditylum_brightwellii.AAC.1
MDGSWMGDTPPPLVGLKRLFAKHFDTSNGGNMEDVPAQRHTQCPQNSFSSGNQHYHPDHPPSH